MGSMSVETPETATSKATSSNNNFPDNQARRGSLTPYSMRPDSAKDKEKERATVPSACVQCREKHLKCDGLTPCSRCITNSFDCIYVRSRRGFKGPRRHGVSSKSLVTKIDNKSCPLVYPNGKPCSGASNVAGSLQTLAHSVDLPHFDIPQEVVAFGPKYSPTGSDISEQCIEAFFYHFYPAHPVTLPRSHFYALRKEKRVEYVESAMRYVGSFYIPQARTAALGLEAERTIYSAECPRDAFRVQAMLILALGLDGYTYQEKALQILTDAEDLAMEIGMNQQEFAIVNGCGSQILEESWRRTWWELYVIDGMIAGVHQKSNFRMKDIVANVALPCEEKEYATGNIPVPHVIQEFDNESFDGRDIMYSSFTYRIAAIRNLGRFLTAREAMLPDVTIIERIDAHLVNWRLHLPEHKKEFINNEGCLDEMVFQAHMITEACTIILHREKSELDSSAARNVTSCAPHKAIIPGQSYNIHAAKTIQAAQNVSKLIQLPVPLVKHTHFFTCVVTLAAIVHLSCWSVFTSIVQDDDLKQQLRLNTGALKTLWQVWPSAGKAFGQVKEVAQNIYAAKKQSTEMGYWSALSDEEVLKRSMDDQKVMEDFQSLM